MNRLIEELKTRARLRLNAHRRAGGGDELRLRDCLLEVAHDAGFAHWDHARHVLGGLAGPGEDHGTLWYTPRCAALLSPWFARHDEARQVQQHQGMAGVLLPYRRQFILAGPDFLVELGLDPDSPLWADAGFDLVSSAGSAAWEALAWQRLRATGTQAAVAAQRHP